MAALLKGLSAETCLETFKNNNNTLVSVGKHGSPLHPAKCTSVWFGVVNGNKGLGTRIYSLQIHKQNEGMDFSLVQQDALIVRGGGPRKDMGKWG